MKTFGATLLLSSVLLSAAIPLAASNIVTDWNTIASTAIVKNGGKASTPSGVWFAYTSLAVYDAVNAITGQYRTFYYRGTGPQTASVDAAAAAAAHRILVNYFPAQQSDLDARFAASLSNISADPAAKDAGVSVGEGEEYRNGFIPALDRREIQRSAVDRDAEDAHDGRSVQ